MTLQRVIPLAFVTILISTILFTNTPPFTCFDPAGCILLLPGESLPIGISRVSSGPGQKTSLEIQQSAELAISQLALSKNFPNLSIQPFFAPCLSGSESGSSIDVASTNNLTIIFGPGCPTDLAEFGDRMTRAAKMSFAVNAFISLNADRLDDIGLISLAQQAAAIISSKDYQSVFVLSTTDIFSTQFLDIFCERLRQENIRCFSNLETITLEQIHPDAQIFITFASEIEYAFSDGDRLTEIPTFIISFSRPLTSGDTVRDKQFWIGPTSWAGGEFLDDYLKTYQTVPESLDARITYESMAYIISSLLESSKMVQGGSWIVPRQAFQNSLLKNFEIFRNSAINGCDGQATCILTPLSLFQLDGNEYKLDKP